MSERKFTVRDIMKRPHFSEAKVIAGYNGMNRQVKWIHILETNENQSLIDGNELILTTGLFYNGDLNTGLSFLRELIRQNASALCIELGANFSSIPSEMIEMAESNDFPLIIFTGKIKFVEITRDIHALLINSNAKALKELETFHKNLSQLNLQSKGISTILQAFHQMFSLNVIYYPIDGDTIFLPQLNPTIQKECIELFRIQIEKYSVENTEQMQKTVDQENILLYQPVIAMGQCLAYVGIVIVEREVDEFLSLSLDYTVTAIAQNLLRRLFIEERNFHEQNILLNDILNNRIQGEELLRTKLGLIPNDMRDFCFYCGVMEWVFPRLYTAYDDLGTTQQSMVVMVRNMLKRHFFQTVILPLGNRVYLLVYQTQIDRKQMRPIQERIGMAILQLKKAVSNLLENREIFIGVSNPAHLLTQAYQGFQEAKQVIEIAKITESNPDPFYENMGIFRILLNMKDNRTTPSFINDYLGRVIQYDKEHGHRLLETLKVYLNNNSSKQKTAKELFIHRQTLYYRLEKLEELLGDLTNPERRICIELALRAYELNRMNFF
ncbi:PucR family transcriptional regulator ligand-binding domain-containing protein [Neobacillus cucumis]|uniref:PucR family transcriptional regulator n=1 Tax=Neobacillus cucumis TaxID=1740721 RepID=UPI0018DF476A|nr:PucR family transcriptional regulator [Neobacillus cucumis]MBI0580855.1 PucR family transcriptional regulator ligand-binding domain-containing protein [Neobacillus cucumis]